MHVQPVRAEGLPVSVEFTDPGRLDGEGNDAFRTLSMWRNDTAYLRLKVSASVDTAVHVYAETDSEEIRADVYVLEPVSASLGVGWPDDFPHTDIPDRMVRTSDLYLRAGEECWLVVEVRTEGNVPEGYHTGEIRLDGDVSVSSHSFQINVSGLSVPEEQLSLDLWQYPWSSYYYYDILQGTEPFGEEHLAVLRKEMELYRELGGRTITVPVIDEPWSHQTYHDTPSLIRWNRDNNGYIWFDFTYFDKWVELCLDTGIDEKIEAFSILPFGNTLYVHNAYGETERLTPAVGSYEWNSLWTLFVQKYTEHLKEKGWIGMAYMFIDERSETDMRTAAELIRSCRDEEGNALKLACAMNRIPEDRELLEMMDSVSFSVGALPEDDPEFYAYVRSLKEKGVEVTLYNCSTVYPNAFAYSEPDESVWTLLYAYSLGFDGYLRWAYNAWTADPLRTFDFQNFEAGDTYLIYPDERDSADPVPARSYRLCMIGEGLRTAAKYRYLLEHAGNGYLRQTMEDALVLRRGRGRNNAYGAMCAASDADRDIITEEVRRIKGMIGRAAAIECIMPAFIRRLVE